MKIEQKKINIIEYTSLPPEIREIFHDDSGFHNDCMLSIGLEELPIMKDIMSWWDDCKDDDPDETFEDFIEGYYKMGWWIMHNTTGFDPKLDFYLNICW